VQSVNAAPSSEHLNVEPLFVDVNWKLALVALVGLAAWT